MNRRNLNLKTPGSNFKFCEERRQVTKFNSAISGAMNSAPCTRKHDTSSCFPVSIISSTESKYLETLGEVEVSSRISATWLSRVETLEICYRTQRELSVKNQNFPRPPEVIRDAPTARAAVCGRRIGGEELLKRRNTSSSYLNSYASYPIRGCILRRDEQGRVGVPKPRVDFGESSHNQIAIK